MLSPAKTWTADVSNRAGATQRIKLRWNIEMQAPHEMGTVSGPRPPLGKMTPLEVECDVHQPDQDRHLDQRADHGGEGGTGIDVEGGSMGQSEYRGQKNGRVVSPPRRSKRSPDLAA
jgi:hypothetical protein